MTDKPHIGEPPPQRWIEALDRADADVVAGRVYDGAPVRQRLRDSAQRMQADAEARIAHGD